MRTIVITGGIATGKSTSVQYLKMLAQDTITVFDCDQETHQLLNSGLLATDIIRLFGKQYVCEDLKANRPALRNLIFHDADAKKQLEALIHPKLKQECLALKAVTMQNANKKAFIIDIPLYFETGATYENDFVCTVATSARTQLNRLIQRNNFSISESQAIINAQFPILKKVELSDISLWNEGPIQLLQQQIRQFYQHFIHD